MAFHQIWKLLVIELIPAMLQLLRE